MSVAINSTRKTVEISWNPEGSVTEPPEEVPGVPTHPIHLPPYVDNALPGEQPEIDNSLPGEQPEIDNELPAPEQPVDPGYGVSIERPSHPIYLPPYIDNSLPKPQPRPDNSLPGDQPYPDNTLPEIPPILIEGLPPEKVEALKSFLLGNLPPFSGGPEYVAPVSSEVEAVQVFAQGQDGDWSNTAVMPNDGLAALAYPQDFVGESYIEVRALDGTLVDSGTISVQ